MKPTLFVCLVLALSTGLLAQESADNPEIDGYITRVASPTDFDANGFRVLLEKTATYSENTRMPDMVQSSILSEPKPYIGAHVQIFGKLDLSKHTIKANEVAFVTDAAELKVKGSALIDGIPPPLVGQAEGKLVRADGYLIFLDSKTAVTLTPPLVSLADVGPNVWITYQGTRRSDGVVVASSAMLVPYQLTSGEEKARKKSDYDPAAVNHDDKQNVASKMFLGVDVKKIPPYADSAMQARVTKIGESLVPKYQRDLPDGDPAKVQFRFQVVDQPAWRDNTVTPGGVILIPKQVVERMENDSQLAAVLADESQASSRKEATSLCRLSIRLRSRTWPAWRLRAVSWCFSSPTRKSLTPNCDCKTRRRESAWGY